jgi:hypothetical protein
MAVSFKGVHFPPEVILMGIRWYLTYPLSTRHVEELTFQRIPTKQKRRSTGPGAKKSLDPQRPEKNGSRMARAATSFRAPSAGQGCRRLGCGGP